LFVLPPPFFDHTEVEAAMMRGNAAVVPQRGAGGISKFFERPSLDRRDTFSRAAAIWNFWLATWE
jgi:hypothetical protein